ncbi:MAG TPA: universal stress protein [Deltaproteobacteria bacterium]|jgi:nucleotide-binding universal stress UspA family protein|nr:universal stress protein [Deltaproteobacteria bacterium]HOI05822.1 universal stress protein [Deltaproteobacteria bacterium]
MNRKTMKKPKRILCYTDLAKYSSYLVKYAYELSKIIDAELFVLHNVTDIGGAAGFYVPHINIEKLEDEVIQAARDKVYAICHQAVGDSIDAAHRLVIRGGLIETLDKVIKDKKIELVVLPHNGDKGILSWLRGDYAERFMREAAIPFVVLPMDAS